MSNSEPRLELGDGLSEVRAVVVPAGHREVDKHTSVSTSKQNFQVKEKGNKVSGSTVPPSKSRKSSERSGPVLPPLVSLGDLLWDAPAWLFSAAVHMLIVIVLGLLFIVPDRQEELVLQFDYYDTPNDLVSGADLDLPLDVEQPLVEEIASQEIPEVAEPVSISPEALEPPEMDRSLAEPKDPIRLSLTGREAGMQQALLDAYGGTRSTQRAVMEGLRWLARNQGKQGLWSMKGPYSDGVKQENHEAATAMALIAFQGAGYTPEGDRSDPFTRVVARAWPTLLSKQDENGNFFQSGRSTGQLYTQALCTIALCELFGMTQDEQYREPAQRAVDYCVSIQSSEGGWRYFPGSGSDLSVTGWFVMALQSARMAGLDVPSPCLDRISQFLDSVSHEYGSYYAYQKNSAPSKSMTAEGLLCRQYLGWRRDDDRLVQGATYLNDNLPTWSDGQRGDQRNVYYWYYATQVCHHMEGNYWRTWNEAMREVLPKNQVQEGRERGSWEPGGDRWGHAGGRLFVTCLSVYMLEVYYRHLPIYQLDLLEKNL